jgi:Na+:H+ antiporter, NhaC family
MVAFRLPALPALLAGAFVGGLFGMVFQSHSLGEVMNQAQQGFVSSTGLEAIDALLSRGGLESMQYTLTLVLCAMAFGGLMEGTGLLGTIADTVLRFAKKSSSLIASVIGTSALMNVIAPD